VALSPGAFSFSAKKEIFSPIVFELLLIQLVYLGYLACCQTELAKLTKVVIWTRSLWSGNFTYTLRICVELEHLMA
jgi:hypothetical protein